MYKSLPQSSKSLLSSSHTSDESFVVAFLTFKTKFDVILLTDDDQLYVSEGIADDFQSDYKVNVMKK